MGLFGVSREVQFRICHHGEPCGVPAQRGEESASMGKREVGSVEDSLWLCAGRASAGKEETSSSSWALPWLQGRRDPILASRVYLRFLLINFLHWVVLAQDRILPGQGAQLDNHNQFSFKKSTCLLYKGPHEKGSCVGNALSQLCEAESLEVKGERELRLQNSSLPCRSQLLMFIIK